MSRARDRADGDYKTDSSVIDFGADGDVTLTHDPDDGLILKSKATADDNPVLLTLQTGETDLAANDVIGKIAFQAPDEGTGTDAILVSAAIQAVAEGDHSSSSNATKLSFMTGASEAAAEKFYISSAGDVVIKHNTNNAKLNFLDQSNSTGFMIQQIGASGSPDLRFHSNTGEVMRMMDEGYVGIGNASNTSSRLYVKSTGASEHTCYLESANQDDAHVLQCYSNSAHSGNCARLYQDGASSDDNALFVHTDASVTPFYLNRGGNDGALIDLRQGGTQEGTISVSGSTISYNAFTGSHWSRLADNSKPTILRGTVMETLDEMCVWHHLKYTIPAVLWKEDDEDKPDNKKVGDERYGEQVIKEPYAKPDNKNVGDKVDYDHKGTTYEATIEKVGDVKHVMCKISDTADCTNVYGVFLDWDNDDDSVNDMYVSAVGTNLVRIQKDQTVSKGDLLSSNGDGTAKKQDDDIIRSKTIGKVLSNIKQETYSDGSYTVPCALYCG